MFPEFKSVGHRYGGRESYLILIAPNISALVLHCWRSVAGLSLSTVKRWVKPWRSQMFVAVTSCHQAWLTYRRIMYYCKIL